METITDIINHLQEHRDKLSITLAPGAHDELIKEVETIYGIVLPLDIREFYEFSNGFEHLYEAFRLIPIEEIIENRKARNYEELYIAEYLAYCDMWELQIDTNDKANYKIINDCLGNFKPITLTSSFAEFLVRFSNGLLFEKDGLYEWYDQIVKEKITSSENAVIANFKVTDVKGTVMLGEIINGEILKGDVLYIDLGGKKRLINISYLKPSNIERGSSELKIEFQERKFDDEMKKLIGSFIDVYRFE